jgi:polyhydroxybutyrate depolymerase
MIPVAGYSLDIDGWAMVNAGMSRTPAATAPGGCARENRRGIEMVSLSRGAKRARTMNTFRMPARLAIGLAALALLAAARPALAALQPGNHPRQIEFEGLLRSYQVHVPASYDGSADVPLVIDIHGLGSNAAQQQVLSGMAPLSDQEGFIVAYPNGVQARWNAGLCCGGTLDDVGFIRAVVAAIEAEATIDRRRIYVTGLSNGGAMSHRLACDASDLFAAAAPMAFPVPFRPLSHCQPLRSIPVLTVMGLTDVLVSYEGGLFPSAAQTFAYWHDINGCDAATPDVLVESGQSRCETYTACRNGVQAGLCSVVARALPNLPTVSGHILYLNDDFNLAQVAWSFLSQFQLPPSVPAPLGGLISGEATLRLKRNGRTTSAVEWDITLGNGTWGAEDATEAVYSGSVQYSGPSGRRATLTVTRDSESRLLESIGELAAEITGAPEPLGITSSKPLVFKGTHARGRLRLEASLPVDTDDASGRYTLRLKGRVE